MTEEDPDDDIGQTAASALFCYQGGMVCILYCI